MKWNIFQRINTLEVRVLVAESNANQLHQQVGSLAAQFITLLDTLVQSQTPKKQISKVEKGILEYRKKAAYRREYYLKQKALRANESAEKQAQRVLANSEAYYAKKQTMKAGKEAQHEQAKRQITA